MSLAARRGLDPQFPVRHFDPPEVVDRSFVVRRLRKNAMMLINAHPRTEYVGNDRPVEAMAASKGFLPTELAILRIAIGPERYTLVCVPEHVWHCRKDALLALKRLADLVDRHCILVPEFVIQRQPRLNTARMIEEACGVHVTPSQRMALMVHLIEKGSSSTMIDCAQTIDHPAPFSAILQMVVIGMLRVDPAIEILADTIVHLPGQEHG
jgi:hypothetical protein